MRIKIQKEIPNGLNFHVFHKNKRCDGGSYETSCDELKIIYKRLLL